MPPLNERNLGNGYAVPPMCIYIKQKGFFDENDRLEELSRMGDPLEKRWAAKNKERHYGYKNHIKIDKESKIIKIPDDQRRSA